MISASVKILHHTVKDCQVDNTRISNLVLGPEAVRLGDKIFFFLLLFFIVQVEATNTLQNATFDQVFLCFLMQMS